ncbi:retron St85 family RNA-directed DNA polymerase [Photobacterium sanguinicancri]|uniref:retron St85 family RNA-directed DNA polymerase n=1 Tax=Photobacterium sanguinicancri TaxID=875932 RepID=UPI0026E2ECA3|nr:retron St85 family RNA-directed DNA polymerase [Photobacterium sanguinicancri]MDO6498185.1 retron St85 family RNA-directed DNA polymerase [Photobacterium sanguinicancri]
MKILSILELKLLEREIISYADFLKLQNLGSHAYRVYTIPKRKAGNRTIAHPSSKLKECQRQLVSILEMYLPVHESAYAYMKGRSIKDNALVHSKSAYLLKMDFQDFFNSITPKILEQHFAKLGVTLPFHELKVLEQLIFWNPSKKKYGKLILSVGSPISPFISNSVMFFFDQVMYEICTKNNIKYSRYADDLTFSTNKKGLLFSIPEIVKRSVKQEFNGELVINDSKTIFSSRAHNRHVTGITINNDGQISLGRQRKRYISSLVYQYTKSELSEEEIKRLKGLLSFCYNVEPYFLQRLTRKYKLNIIDDLLRKGTKK